MKKEETKLEKAIKYCQESYCDVHLNSPYMLLGNVVELIKILTGKVVDVDTIEIYRKK